MKSRVYFAFLMHASFAIDISNPAPNDRLLAAWLDTANPKPSVMGDRPTALNQRIGFNFGAFQYAQNLPLTDYPFPIEQVTDTNTNAVVYLTVYSSWQPWTLADSDIKNLTAQCGQINAGGRAVLLRFWPEMNGNWFPYGQQPTEYIAIWKKVRAQLKLDAPKTYMVWAPSSGNGYPFNFPLILSNTSQNTVQEGSASTVNSQDFQLLDTNGDGVVDNKDDPFSPYYPGDSFVDWIGLSVYHYSGVTYPFDYNAIPTPGKFESIMAQGAFYATYAISHGKPMMIAESGAAFHSNTLTDPASPTTPVPSEVDIKQAFWRQYITNATFLQTYPKIHLICLFEFYKPEETLRVSAGGGPDWRDFRVTVNTTVRNAFLQDYASVSSMYTPATILPTPIAAATPKKNSEIKSNMTFLTYTYAIVLGFVLFALVN